MNTTNPLSLLTFLLFLTHTHALTTARVWTHFYPSCPTDNDPNMAAYETAELSPPEIDIHAGTCQGIATPSIYRNAVNHVSIDAEIFWAEPFDTCNITVHEVPECIDPPLIVKEIRNRVAVSECERRNFAAYSQVWVKLECGEVGVGQQQKQYSHRPLLNAGLGSSNGTARNGTFALRKSWMNRLARLPIA
ncbi:hypothetical protein ASPWEDRAFT_27787 [Aspergillus wentii DTO 134E9]|uniref:Ecp2 effector protein domain-containing protein n=1 Tax=Aspergillus wentii DTO 134E9 TaxID=1073089 RepID=A0A1L9RJN8_ASPWE|nr:uncharacterized protein ASPWEDRAFT_27787 [Aspergillus wentii DTO 134E9]KAI9931929.1 hypothetical protein MW887_009430 [Aspergillus wentii]OJJ35114.1 hypothetical protein ASPWEDRAFT_27787 [Aspergillus wentii DTO 134E9]